MSDKNHEKVCDMVEKKIILIIGENKCNELFEKSINLYISRNDITDIILVTYDDENIEFVKSLKSIEKVLVPRPNKKKINIEYQKYLYDIGIKCVSNKNYKEDKIFILKTRMDVFIDNNQLDYIFSQNYKINLQKNTLFPYKIWVPWTHITKPFYTEDCCFYSHISVMGHLSPYIDDFPIVQGHSHIRYFLLLAREYNLYNDDSSYKHYESMQRKFILNEDTKNILIKYRECIKEHFIINTQKDGIIFRQWNNINFYKKPSNNILDIINKNEKAKGNLKPVYNIKDFLSINLEV